MDTFKWPLDDLKGDATEEIPPALLHETPSIAPLSLFLFLFLSLSLSLSLFLSGSIPPSPTARSPKSPVSQAAAGPHYRTVCQALRPWLASPAFTKALGHARADETLAQILPSLKAQDPGHPRADLTLAGCTIHWVTQRMQVV